MDDHLLNRHSQFVTNDLDHARDVLGRLWENHKISVNPGWSYNVRWHQANLRQTSLSYTDSPTSLHIVSSPVSHTYRFGMHESGCIRQRINGQETVSTPAFASLHAPGQELEIETRPFRALVLTLDGKFVDKALARRFGPLPPFEVWAREFSVDGGAAAALRSLCRWMAHELDRPDSSLLTSSRAVAGLEGFLLGLLLDCLSERQPPPKRRTDDAAHRQVKRALEWLDENFADPVTIEDLADVAGVGVRSLQSGFRRVQGCTPMQAVSRRRLQAARDTLRAPPPQASVTQVATDCGFFHFGRFARDYRLAFGETPSTTLERFRRR